jgi:hypothetical protein
MTIPDKKQEAFVTWFKERAMPGFEKYGAIKHELYREPDKNTFVERLFFVDCFDVKDFFNRVKSDPQARKLSGMGESEFGVINMELRILEKVC